MGSRQRRHSATTGSSGERLERFLHSTARLLLYLLSEHCCVVAPWLDQQRFLYDPLLDNVLDHVNNPERCSPRANRTYFCAIVSRMWPGEQALLRVALSCGAERWEVKCGLLSVTRIAQAARRACARCDVALASLQQLNAEA